MKKLCQHPRTILLLLSFAIIAACKVEYRSNAQKSGAGEPGSQAAKPQTLVKTQGTSEWDNVHCGLVDKHGNLWFGTTGEGVYCYNGESFTNYTVKDGLNSNTVWSIFEDKAGNILFGTQDGISRYDGGAFTNFTAREVFGKNSIWSMTEDNKGNLWIATGDQGIYIYDGKLFASFLLNTVVFNVQDLTLNWVNGMLADKNGTIWFSSWAPAAEGVCRYDGKSLLQFTQKEGLLDSLVHCVLEDKNGNLWFGTRDHGAFRYDGNSFIHLTGPEGPGNACIYSMAEDKGGNLWFVTERNGVYRYDGKSFQNFTTENGLIHNSVFCVVEDTAGNIWFGTRNVGLCRYDGKSFVNFSE